MNSIITILALSLATWRLSSLFANESGPFKIFDRIRRFVFAQTLTGGRYSVFWIALHDLINCMWCSSVWFAAFLAIILARSIAEWIVLTLACSALSIIIQERIMNGKS